MDDCISRQAVIDTFKKWQPYMATRIFEYEEELFSLPSVIPKPKTGHWETSVDRWGEVVTTVNGYRCSECGEFNGYNDNFCPNCGADMREGEA